jgi:hypothetical protein
LGNLGIDRFRRFLAGWTFFLGVFGFGFVLGLTFAFALFFRRVSHPFFAARERANSFALRVSHPFFAAFARDDGALFFFFLAAKQTPMVDNTKRIRYVRIRS